MWSAAASDDPLLSIPPVAGESAVASATGVATGFPPPRRPRPTTTNQKGVYDAPKLQQQPQQQQLDAEDAETANFDTVVRRSSFQQHQQTNSAPESRSLSLQQSQQQVSMTRMTTPATTSLLTTRPKLVNLAMRARSLQQLQALHTTTAAAPQQQHRRNASRAQDLLEGITKAPEGGGDFGTGSSTPHKGLLLSHVDQNQGHHHKSKSDCDNDDDNDDETDDDDNYDTDGEGLPFLGDNREQYGSVAASTVPAPVHHRHHRRRKHWMVRWMRRIGAALHPRNLFRLACDAIAHSFFVWFGLPLTMLAWFFYYHLGNPELDFLPATATLAWWLNFGARQLVTLDVARFSQWLVFDQLILGSKVVSRLVGPVVSLYCIQAKGWPIVLTFWSLLNLTFLHGDSKFCTHWLYWTGIRIYSLSHANSGTYILNSSIYLRALLAMLLAGFGTTMKRFWLSFQFSRRQCMEFKPRLEKILVEMILVTEVASFAQHAAELHAQEREALDENVNSSSNSNNIIKSSSSKDAGIQSVGFEISKGGVDFDDGEDDDEEGDTGDGNETTLLAHNVPILRGRSFAEVSSSHLRYKYMLDSWETPINKNDKAEVSIRDVLLFQAALMYMNDNKPFGEGFGQASTRDECIESAEHVYSNLLTLDTSENPLLDFNVLALSICDDDGSMDEDKKKILRRLFRPDAKDQITELAFIQSCDSIFKRLCFFRASVGNSSVIDKVLASIVDWFYYFTLTLMLLSLLRFNPWTLMVSLTSILVSASFALGSSLSRYVEGILLIALTRPYDLGDRIYIGPPDTISSSGITVDVSSQTWFVEGITLTTTTLRNARTNEVSILHNWAIVGSKIINCNRSPGAIILLDIKLHISILEGTNLSDFQAQLQKYVETHPRVWDSLVFCRHDSIDTDNEQVSFA